VPSASAPATLSKADWRRVRIAAYAAFAIGLVGFVWFAGIPTDRLGLAALAIGFLSIGLLGHGWKAWFGLLRDWLPFTAVLLVYDYSRGFASPYSAAQRQAGSYPTEDVHNALGLPLQVRFPIVVDQWLAGGTTPTQWLQAHLHAVDTVPWFGALVSLVYVSHYLVAPVTAVWLWIRDRSAFRVWMSMVIALAVLGLTTYVLLPTAPPWLASVSGDLDGPPVGRYTSEGFDQIGLHTVGSALALGQHLVNPVAAMPSLHVAFATLAAGFWWSRLRSPARWLLWLYPLAMSFSLAYGGEHYVTDELAGVLYAAAILLVARHLGRRTAARNEPLVETPTG
jgi:membrane-associated phospholipid phosphatase